jgi:uncharacterized protein YkwD
MNVVNSLGRRLFLKALAPSLAVALASRPLAGAAQTTLSNLDEMRANLLQMINEERAVAKVPQVAMDDLAGKVAMAHAQDMVKGNFASHWGSDGRKPYHRYSFAGGVHFTTENVSSADNAWPWKPTDIRQDLAYLHVRLYQETPPNDGHRRAILKPHNTHVGFGLALEELRIRMVELFVAKYVEFSHFPKKAKPGATLEISGRLMNPDHTLHVIEVFYEPLPSPPDHAWLQTSRDYSLPDESVNLRPKLPEPLFYKDRVKGIVEYDGRTFKSPIKLFKATSGMYSIVCWIRTKRSEPPFPASCICIQAERD